jgi:hypothetical protein
LAAKCDSNQSESIKQNRRVGHASIQQEALQRLITYFTHACTDFGLTISLKKTNAMGQDASYDPRGCIDDYILDVVEDFTYLGSAI